MPITFSELSPRHKGILFFSGSLFLAGLVLIWMFWLNRGLLIVTAPAPYAIDFRGAPDVTCTTDPCQLKLLPGTYEAVFLKNDFFEERQVISIRRFKETAVTINFRLTPKVTAATDWQPMTVTTFPNNLADVSFFPKVRPPLTRQNIPPQPKFVLFSGQDSRAIITTSQELFSYDTATGIRKALPIDKPLSMVWSPDEAELFYLEQDTSGNRQTLGVLAIDKLTSTVVTVFPSPITSGQLFVSPDGNLLALLDNSQPRQGIYIVDTKKRWKKRISIGKKAVAASFNPSGQSLLLEFRPERSRQSTVSILDLTKQQFIIEDLATELQKMTWLDDDRVVFATNQAIRTTSSSTEMDLLELVRDTFVSTEASDVLLLLLSQEKSLNYFFKPAGQEVYKPDRLEFKASEKRLYFRDGDKLFYISL